MKVTTLWLGSLLVLASVQWSAAEETCVNQNKSVSKRQGLCDPTTQSCPQGAVDSNSGGKTQGSDAESTHDQSGKKSRE